MPALLDELLPEFDVHEIHSAEVPGSPHEAMAAARAVTPREIRLMGALMGLRSLPGRIKRTPIPTTRDEPFVEQALKLGFVLLGERSDEVVIGAVGRFWSPAGNRPLKFAGPEEFLAFDRPGFAKALMNIAVRPQGSRALISTETRIAGTDPGATRRFRAYWLLIGPWSGLIRRGMLRAVERRVAAA